MTMQCNKNENSNQSASQNRALHIKLFTTLGCHLCDDAKAMLVYVQEQDVINFSIISVEISENETLMEKYGMRIPVLQHSITNKELGWPFDMEQLMFFLQSA